jgi:hypothetical protein
MDAGMIPITLLFVDGSARTLTWVVVVPSTGGRVGTGLGGSGVCVACGVDKAGSVAVGNSGVDAVPEFPPSAPQAETNKASAVMIGSIGLI